jgi:hypothetical protein
LGIENRKFVICNFVLLRRCVEVRDRLMGTRSEDCGDNGRRGAARAAAVAARKTLPSDEQIRAHAPELITFSPREKTDWGKKRSFLKIYFGHRSTPMVSWWRD